MAGEFRVLLTRPAGRGAELTALLAADGCSVTHIPCLAIEPVEFAHQPREIADLDVYRLVIFVSPAAAELAGELITRYWPQWPLAITWVATGAATARCLVTAGLAEPVLVPSAETGESAEGMLQLDALQQVQDARVLICKGSGGREVLAQTLLARGAQVHELELYQCTLPAEVGAGLQQQLAGSPPDLVVVLSGRTLDNLLELAGGLASRLTMVPICVPGERLALRARQAGFRTIVTADGAAAAALQRAIRDWRQNQQ